MSREPVLTTRNRNLLHAPMSVRRDRTALGIVTVITYRIINATGEVVGRSATEDGAHAEAKRLADVWIADVKARIAAKKEVSR